MRQPNQSDIRVEDLEIRPIERAETIPASWYSSDTVCKLEKDTIFSKTWQYVGHASSLAAPGDLIVATAAGNPIIAVHGNDGRLRAFYNVCRHRGGPLALEDGNAKVLQCKYHGWTYLLDGSLRGTPRFDRSELFDRKDFGLFPVALEVWQGLVFVHLSGGAATLESVMKEVAERIPEHSLAQKKFYRRVVYEVSSNWKVYVDNYLEGYHVPHVHPELFRLLDFQNYVTETFEYSSLQHSPLRKQDGPYAAAEGPALYFFVWPNFMLNLLRGRLQTNLVIPTGTNRCKVIFDYYFDDVGSESALRRIEEDIEYSDKVQQEDAEICKHVQRGLESQVYNKGRFSVEMEQGVYHFQTLLKKAFASALGV